ncbi:peptide methionine sulfoxide reductase msra [hydrocarbon metagenome]|uniref:peptide-methionine (S)-S-oxide reductase n=1 Tax=hydrocarbon metagenome TaxID=938273 RepID=A0A0W8F5K9_9ZZZZ
MERPPRRELATFSGGCFWDLEAAFRHQRGVLATVAGYTGGSVPDPDYELVASGTTGHAEAVQVAFDPDLVTYNALLDIFWNSHDPVQPPAGSERSAIYYHSQEQEEQALASRDWVQESLGERVVTTVILPVQEFWRAEECHQQYYEKCGRGYGTAPKYWE